MNWSQKKELEANMRQHTIKQKHIHLSVALSNTSLSGIYCCLFQNVNSIQLYCITSLNLSRPNELALKEASCTNIRLMLSSNVSQNIQMSIQLQEYRIPALQHVRHKNRHMAISREPRVVS